MRKFLFALFAFGIVFVVAADVSNLLNKKISEQLYELSFSTKNLDKVEFAYVVVPKDYEKNNTILPTVYLLHGWNCNYTSYYVNNGKNLEKFANLYNFIIIMPDGGTAGWYIDSPFKKGSNYESVVAEDIVNVVDQSFNTFKLPKKRAITGFSMGGFGAFHIGFKHPNIFGVVGSVSGGLALVEAGEVQPERHFDIDSVLSSDSSKWKDYDVKNLLQKAKESNQSIIFECGMSDIFIKINRDFHADMLEKEIPHEYRECQGGHNWDYWDNSIDYQMLFFSKQFEADTSKGR